MEKLNVSHWAEKYRVVSVSASIEPGPWRNTAAPFQSGVMNSSNIPEIEKIVFMKSGCMGFGEIINNVLGSRVNINPGPMLLVQPNISIAKEYVKSRFDPMVQDCNALSNLIQDVIEDPLKKVFPGGLLTVAGADVPASYSLRPVRDVYLDEIDCFPFLAEGDPVLLAIKKSKTFKDRLILMGSTPTVKGISRIEAAFEESNKQYYLVPCYKCGSSQRLLWSNVVWPKNNPSKAVYQCGHCSETWTDARRWASLKHGEWIATEPHIKKIAGFHISEMYSPWRTLADMATAFLAAKGNPSKMKLFINLSLGETWEETREVI